MKWIQRMARPRYILIFLGAVIVCEALFAFLTPRLHAHGVFTTLDLMMGFSYADAQMHLALYSDSVKIIYNWFQLVDLVFPFSYGLLFASLITLILIKIFPSKDQWLILGYIPLLGTACDLAENLGIFTMIRIYPEPFEVWAVFTSAAGVVKFICLAASILIIVCFTIILILKRIAARKHLAGKE